MGMGVELNFSGSFVGGENEAVTVFDAVFYRAGTVKRGSYCYDAPKEENIFCLGQVPARYYSEVVWQLERATASSTETDPDWQSGNDGISLAICAGTLTQRCADNWKLFIAAEKKRHKIAG